MTSNYNKVCKTRYEYKQRVKEQEKLLAEKKRRDELYKLSMSRFLANASKTLLNKQ